MAMIAPDHSKAAQSATISFLHQERLYIGIDIGREKHYAGFISNTLLEKYRRPEKCPSMPFTNCRADFEALLNEMASYAPLSQCVALVEKTGHYHVPLLYFLQAHGVEVYIAHALKRPQQKTDKRDALTLANKVYSQVELGVQCVDKKDEVRKAHEPSEQTAELRTLTRRRYELTQSCTRIQNRLTAICDELFPEFGEICKEVNSKTALAIREAFPTPQSIVDASFEELKACRSHNQPGNAKLKALQELAKTTIGVKNSGRIRGLVFEQKQLISELGLLEGHLEDVEAEIKQLTAESREGQILTSLPGIGELTAANIIGAIGSIVNFESSGRLKGYLGWAPNQQQTGDTMDSTKLTKGGNRVIRKELYLAAWRAIKMNTEWTQIYNRLVERLCGFDKRKKRYIGKNRVVGRIAGQMVNQIYALLWRDHQLLASLQPGETPPPPEVYNREIHRAHRLNGLRKMKA